MKNPPLSSLHETADHKGHGNHSEQLNWSIIRRENLSSWIRCLADEEQASIRQYPLFNERFRRILTKPVYLKCLDASGDIRAFACVISFGCRPFKCGVVIDGPVLFGQDNYSKRVAEALIRWFRSNRFAFVRVSNNRQRVIDALSGLPGTLFKNPFRFIPCYGGELVVPLKTPASDMLAGFQQIARQEIKRAKEAGCVVTYSTDLNELRKSWPMFNERAKGKGYRLGKLEDYESMFRLTPRPDSIRIYIAYYDGKATYSAVFLREHSTVHYFLGALDLEALGEHPTPSCLCLWEAMQDYRSLGCNWCNLGGRGGSYYAFKKKFRPSDLPSPASITIILRPLLYRVWSRLFIPILGCVNRGVALMRTLRK